MLLLCLNLTPVGHVTTITKGHLTLSKTHKMWVLWNDVWKVKNAWNDTGISWAIMCFVPLSCGTGINVVRKHLVIPLCFVGSEVSFQAFEPSHLLPHWDQLWLFVPPDLLLNCSSITLVLPTHASTPPHRLLSPCTSNTPPPLLTPLLAQWSISAL